MVRKNLFYAILIALLIEIIAVIVFGYLKDNIIVTIVGSILSGTIVGALVTFSQANLSASIYEESRINNDHLNDLKTFLKGKGVSDLVMLMTMKDKENKQSEELFKLEDIGIHWVNFSKKLKELCGENETLQEYNNLSQEKKHNLNEICPAILDKINKEVEKMNQENEFLLEFFQPGHDLSYISLAGSSQDIKNNVSLIALFNKFLLNQINAASVGSPRNNKTSAEFKSFFQGNSEPSALLFTGAFTSMTHFSCFPFQ